MWAFSDVFLFVVQDDITMGGQLLTAEGSDNSLRAIEGDALTGGQLGMWKREVFSRALWKGHSGQLLPMALFLSEGLINTMAAAFPLPTGIRFLKLSFL